MKKQAVFLLGFFAFFIIALTFISVFYSNESIKKQEVERGELDVLQALIDSTNNKHRIINEELKGKILVINVWATWCGPCIKEIPELNILKEEFKSDQIRFMAFNENDSINEFAIMEKRKIEFNYELYFGEGELINRLYGYKIEKGNLGIPLNIVINEEGKIEFFYVGYKPEKIEEIREYLKNV